jgi:hypothetical protein
MATAVLDLVGLLKDIPLGAWVAISEAENKVLSFGLDPQAVLDEARDKGEPHPLIVKVPDQSISMFL